MWRIVWNNLRNDRVRFVTAVVGVTFAITLIAVQAAIFLGTIQASSLLVRGADADLWVVPERTFNADFALTMPDRRMYQVLGVPGVEKAGRLIVGFGTLRLPDGRQEPVMAIGADTNHDWMGVERHRDRRILGDRAILLDHREQYRFGTPARPVAVGDRAELNGYRVEIAGILPDKSSFIATPYVFCRYEAALNFTPVQPEHTTFVMVKCEPGADVLSVQRQLRERLSDVEVLTSEQFATRCWHYWVLGTGMGMALGLSAALAFIVGAVIVGQTTFTGVLARLREYATLKAVGFRNHTVIGVVALQSLAVVAVGYPLAVVATLLFAHYAGKGGTALVMKVSPELLAAMVPIAVVMCGLASLGAVAKALRVAPAKVFR